MQNLERVTKGRSDGPTVHSKCVNSIHELARAGPSARNVLETHPVGAGAKERSSAANEEASSEGDSDSPFPARLQYPAKNISIPTSETAVEVRQAQQQVEQELHQILISKMFSRSPRLSGLLKYIVNNLFTPNAARLKEYTIGLDVFDRDHSFDPSTDPIVRVEASRLRNRLSTYYQSEGAASRFRLELPRGGYTLKIRRVTEEQLHLQNDVASPQNTIAVLPFLQIGDHAIAVATCGLFEGQLIHALTQRPSFLVVPRMSSFQPHPEMSAREMGAHLGASILVEGSVLTNAGDECRILTYLVDANSGYNLWSGSYEVNSKTLASVIECVSEELVRAMARPTPVPETGV
jgi:TolB-like protein